jgi:hypothetical protein
MSRQWSRDGRFVVYSENDPKTQWDIWVLPMDGGGERKPGAPAGTPFLHSEFNELLGQLSPDGQLSGVHVGQNRPTRSLCGFISNR